MINQISHGPKWLYLHNNKYNPAAFKCVDHIEKTKNGWRLHPYWAYPKDLYGLSLVAEENGYDVFVSGGSQYNKDCVIIDITKKI